MFGAICVGSGIRWLCAVRVSNVRSRVHGFSDIRSRVCWFSDVGSRVRGFGAIGCVGAAAGSSVGLWGT